MRRVSRIGAFHLNFDFAGCMYVHVVNSRRGLPGGRMLMFLYETVVDRQRLHQKPSL